MTLTRCRNREEQITISKTWDNMRTHKRHSRPAEIEKGSGLCSVKCENVGTHKWHSLSVDIEKGSELRSVKCQNTGTHKQHSQTVEIGKGGRLHSVASVWLHLEQSSAWPFKLSLFPFSFLMLVPYASCTWDISSYEDWGHLAFGRSLGRICCCMQKACMKIICPCWCCGEEVSNWGG